MSCEIDILAKLNVMLIMKHGAIFNIDDKVPSWDWTINKLDEIITFYEKQFQN